MANGNGYDKNSCADCPLPTKVDELSLKQLVAERRSVEDLAEFRESVERMTESMRQLGKEVSSMGKVVAEQLSELKETVVVLAETVWEME